MQMQSNKKDSLLGFYKLKRDKTFRVGNSAFTLSKDAIVEVTQMDNFHSKILIKFDNTTLDWFSFNVLEDFDKVIIHNIEEFDYEKEYKDGEYFTVGNEVFKVNSHSYGDQCKYCDFNSEYSDLDCKIRCSEYEREDSKNIYVILYDTLED